MPRPILLTIAVLSLFVFSLSLTPVASHFTLGNSTASYPFHVNNYDPHVQGVLGYVWPGVGLIGRGTLSRPEAPGYQPPSPKYPEAMKPRDSWLQLEGNAYEPFGAILASTDDHPNRGDLLFGFNYSRPTQKRAYYYLFIWIPPEFSEIYYSKIVTTITNVYDQISLWVLSREESIAPGWTLIRIGCDSGRLITFKADGTDAFYYVRINDVVAPKIAGKYFFKIALSNSSDTLIAAQDMIPTQNWPVLLVKGEVDPAIIRGTIRYGGWNSSLYGSPLRLPGRVRAVGVADDPYIGRSTGRRVEAREYFNNTAQGYYEVEGVAPGVYDIYASAAGYPETKIASKVRLLKGQSFQIDGYLAPGAVITGEAFSKCGAGEVSWFYDQSPIKIEIYRSASEAESSNRDGETKAVTWSPYGSTVKQFQWWGLTEGDYPRGGRGVDPDGVGPPQSWAVSKSSCSFRFQFGEPGKYGAPSELDGHVPQVRATWISGLSPATYFLKAFSYGYAQVALDGDTFQHVALTVPSVQYPGDIHVPFDLRLSSIIEKTVHFHALPGTTKETGIETGRYLYAEALDKTGRRVAWRVQYVPAGSMSSKITLHGFLDQRYWYGWGRNYGLKAGTYRIKTYMYGYVSQADDTVTIGLCGSVTTISNHMHKGVSFDLTVYSKDWETPRNPRPWTWDGETIYVIIRDNQGSWLDYTTGTQNRLATYVKIGRYSGRDGGTVNYDVGNYPKSFNTGRYRFQVLTYGYVQRNEFSVYAVAQNVTADIALDVAVGANISLTIEFRHENVFSHLIADSSIRIRLFNRVDKLVGEWLTSDPKTRVKVGTELLNYMPFCTTRFSVIIAGLPSVHNPDPYFNFGYDLTIPAPYGVDAQPSYLGEWAVELEIVPWYGDVNGDDRSDPFPPLPGILYGESPKYIPANHLGPCRLRNRIRVPSAHLGGEVSIIASVDQNALLYGNVYCYTYCDDYRTTSWVTLSAKGAEGTFNYYSLDGSYAMWLPSGDYDLAVTEWSWANEGHRSQAHKIHLSDGQAGQFDIYLTQSNIPVPENVSTVTLATAVAMVWLAVHVQRKSIRAMSRSNRDSHLTSVERRQD